MAARFARLVLRPIEATSWPANISVAGKFGHESSVDDLYVVTVEQITRRLGWIAIPLHLLIGLKLTLRWGFDPRFSSLPVVLPRVWHVVPPRAWSVGPLQV